MCGIIGVFRAEHPNFEGALNLLKHRGPDAQKSMPIPEGIIGHTRLSILDLSEASDQPYRYEETAICFNGEIWNYQELRAELKDLGYQFETTGDTEVLIKFLHCYGMEDIDRIDGMFAFSYFDGESLFLARDRYGKIPLFYRKNGKGIMWASEMKALNLWPSLGSQRLPAGTYWNLTEGTYKTYYSAARAAIRPKGPLIKLLKKAVRKRMVSDAPLCCLISGGLDSSLILSIAKKIRPDIVAYTAYFDPDSEDLSNARRLCNDLKIELREVLCPTPTTLAIDSVIRSIESPMKAQIEIGLLCEPLAAQLRRDGFKVCLSGEGADELFGGYGNMQIRASKLGDQGWRQLRVKQIEKMGRGNFQRCNMIFMANSVECRLPFLDRAVVEYAINSTKEQCPPGKKLLKKAAKGILPDYIINRQKETFQGAANIPEAVAEIIHNPIRYYNSIYGRLYSV